ncbi:AraC family ligand binding domain-containing protein [Streptomyces enissocaesilis]|uniref:AraC-type arabinose-binding/dimerisation domain-containing protein n=1 Tax=Streptomyces enissocaesilis TaxID=332589 RepID=A0ABP6K5Z9_9ACTN
MLELAILGSLADGPLRGDELRRRTTRLSSHFRPGPAGDGSLCPVIDHLVGAGLLDRRPDPGAVAARQHVLSLTSTGRAELLRRLRAPDDLDISDSARYFTILAFLSRLPDPGDRHAVLRRRLEFLEQPGNFSYGTDAGSGAGSGTDGTDDPYRRAMLAVARAADHAERSWLREVTAEGNEEAAQARVSTQGPGVLARLAALAGSAPAHRGGALWRLGENGRQLDANVIRLAPRAHVAPHVEPDLDVLVYVAQGAGRLECGGARHELAPGAVAWLPHGARRAVSAGPDGLLYLTVHRRRPGLTIRKAPPAPPAPPVAEEGGEAACLPGRVCPDCGRLAPERGDRYCGRCGTPLPSP